MWLEIFGYTLIELCLFFVFKYGVKRTLDYTWYCTLPIILGYGLHKVIEHEKQNVLQEKAAQARRAYCPPPGPSLPPPDRPLASPPFLPFDRSPCTPDHSLEAYDWYASTTFVVKASIGNLTLIDYAHAAEGSSHSAQPSPEVHASGLPGYSTPHEPLHETKFRIASVTKLFTVLAVLLSKETIGWEDAITKHIPELDARSYGEVTIGALAGQTSGLGRFGYVGDLSFIPGFNPVQLGMGVIQEPLPGCDPFPGGRVCTRSEVLDMFNHPAYWPHSPNFGPLYSNIAYNLLGMALESAHSKPFDRIIEDLIFDPIGMTHSTFEMPKEPKSAVLPQKGAQWAVPNFGNFNPAGGLWSTPNDMLVFLQALLHHKLLSPVETRKWLQPRSMLPTLHQLVGAPWEILRPTDLDVRASRPINLYTKAGGVAGYSSFAVLIPEYDIAISISAAGNTSDAAIVDILPLVVKPLVAFADHEARLQATTKYAGTYSMPESNSSITLTLDDGPGMSITSFGVNSIPVLERLAKLRCATCDEFSARLYPTDPDSLRAPRETWRILFDGKRPNSTFADMDCGSWNWGDPWRYAGLPLDTVVFEFDGEKAASIELVGWRTTLSRAK